MEASVEPQAGAGETTGAPVDGAEAGLPTSEGMHWYALQVYLGH